MPVAEQGVPVDQQVEAVTVPVAASRLGKSPDAIRSAIRRDKLSARKGNDGDWLVFLPPAETVTDSSLQASLDRTHAELEQAMRQSADRQATVDELRERIRYLEASAEHNAALLLKSTDRAARAEGEAAALRDALADLARRLDMATVELADARRPWWRRLLG